MVTVFEVGKLLEKMMDAAWGGVLQAASDLSLISGGLRFTHCAS
jgi:hypothetical protein